MYPLLHNAPCAAGLSAETLLRFKAEVDLQRKLSFHPNVVRFIGACCELPAGLTDALAEAAGSRSSNGSGAGELRYVVPPGLARGVKLAIVMELCHLGSLFSMIGQVSGHVTAACWRMSLTHCMLHFRAWQIIQW